MPLVNAFCLPPIDAAEKRALKLFLSVDLSLEFILPALSISPFNSSKIFFASLSNTFTSLIRLFSNSENFSFKSDVSCVSSVSAFIFCCASSKSAATFPALLMDYILVLMLH